jgi:hypothetical protein
MKVIKRSVCFGPRWNFAFATKCGGCPFSGSSGFGATASFPENYIFDRMPNYITGVVWIGTEPRGQEKWKFVLMLPSSPSSRSDIAWSELLPAPEASGWLIVATEEKELEIKLGH